MWIVTLLRVDISCTSAFLCISLFPLALPLLAPFWQNATLTTRHEDDPLPSTVVENRFDTLWPTLGWRDLTPGFRSVWVSGFLGPNLPEVCGKGSAQHTNHGNLGQSSVTLVKAILLCRTPFFTDYALKNLVLFVLNPAWSAFEYQIFTDLHDILHDRRIRGFIHPFDYSQSVRSQLIPKWKPLLELVTADN